MHSVGASGGTGGAGAREDRTRVRPVRRHRQPRSGRPGGRDGPAAAAPLEPGDPCPAASPRRGREVLSYVPGTAVTPPFPEWALTDEALVSVADLLRSYHRAVETFDWSPHAWPPCSPQAFSGELISHNDVNLDNVVFRGGRAVALIDFDLAGPGSRLWDVAGAARLWTPLRPQCCIDDSWRTRVLDRLRLFV